MILKIYSEDGYIIYDNLSRVSVKVAVSREGDYEGLRRFSTLIVSPDKSGPDSYAQIWARSKAEGDMLFLVNTIAYLCNDSGKTVETIRATGTQFVHNDR